MHQTGSTEIQIFLHYSSKNGFKEVIFFSKASKQLKWKVSTLHMESKQASAFHELIYVILLYQPEHGWGLVIFVTEVYRLAEHKLQTQMF